MPIELPAWAPIVATLVAGGAAGAFINYGLAKLKDRKQPIHYRIEESPLFDNESMGQNLTLKITEQDGWSTELDNLHTVDIEIFNRSNKDFDAFSFGVTLPSDENIVRLITEVADRHHNMTASTDIGARVHTSAIDFKLEPFHRSDVYSVRLFVHATMLPRGGESANVSTAEPVRLTRMSRGGDIGIDAVINPTISIWPLTLSLSKR